jgi:hypothetical protein
MAKKNTEAKEKPTAPAQGEQPAAPTAPTGVEGGVSDQNTELHDQIGKLHALLPSEHAEATMSDADVVKIAQRYILELKARVVELETGRQVSEGSAPQESDSGYARAGDPSQTWDAKDLAVEAYDLFVKSQADGVFPAWSELPEQTQKIWRDSYRYVRDGGKPRTDYENAVAYLIVSAQ